MSANPFPDLEPADYEALLEDIKKRGMVYPVIRDQHGQMIDGHQRERACHALGIIPKYEVVACAGDAEREALAIVLNTHRRHLTAEQKRAAILRLAPTGMTQAAIGAAVGVSQGRVAQVLADAPEVISPHNPDVKDIDGQPYRRTSFGGWAPVVEGEETAEPLLDKQGRPPEARGGRPRAEEVAKRPAQVPLDRLLTVKVMMTLTWLDTGQQSTYSVGAPVEDVPGLLRDAVVGVAERLLRAPMVEDFAADPEDDDEYHEEGETVDPDIDGEEVPQDFELK